MVGTWPIVSLPDCVTETCSGGADVRVAVVAIDAPRLQHAFNIAFIARPANVIDDFVAAILFERFANSASDRFQRFLPADAFPLARATLADALKRMQDAVGVIDLIDRGRPFGTQSAAACRVKRVALELANLVSFFLDVRQ